MSRVKKTKTLAELVEAESTSAPNPFVIACMEVVMRSKPIVEAVPPYDKIDAHSACVAALLLLQVEPTFVNLQALRAALEDYEIGEFRN